MDVVQKSFAIFFLIFAVLSSLGGLGVYDHYFVCPHTGLSLQLESKHEWFVGCFVKTQNGKWVKAENYRGVAE